MRCCVSLPHSLCSITGSGPPCLWLKFFKSTTQATSPFLPFLNQIIESTLAKFIVWLGFEWNDSKVTNIVSCHVIFIFYPVVSTVQLTCSLWTITNQKKNNWISTKQKYELVTRRSMFCYFMLFQFWIKDFATTYRRFSHKNLDFQITFKNWKFWWNWVNIPAWQHMPQQKASCPIWEGHIFSNLSASPPFQWQCT